MNYTFKVAEHAGDYRQCIALAAAEEQKHRRLSWPTVMAYEDEELVGFLSTDTSQDMVVAGPLVMKSDKRRPRLTLKLAEEYENSLRNLGIKSYIMGVLPDSIMHKAIERYVSDTSTKYGEAEGWLFYVRKLWAAA